MTRQEAVKKTDDFISNLNFQQAKEILGTPENLNLENCAKVSTEVGNGFYYNEKFLCSEMIKTAIFLTYLSGLKKQYNS